MSLRLCPSRVYGSTSTKVDARVDNAFGEDILDGIVSANLTPVSTGAGLVVTELIVDATEEAHPVTAGNQSAECRPVEMS